MFKPATKQQSRLRLALIGPSGAGKTYTALKIASQLGSKVAVIDTERGSASKYADDYAFDVAELQTFDPRKYVEAIKAADAAGYDVLVIDSLSHAWAGVGGALEMVDKARARSQSGNSFTAWKDVTPLHNQLVDSILQCRAHVIVTMRAKTEYVVETNERGKQTPRKVGLAPIQRDGLEYEFDVVADLDLDHAFIVSKTRCKALDSAVIPQANGVAEMLRAWLSDGAPRIETAPNVTSERTRTATDEVKRLKSLWAMCRQLWDIHYTAPAEWKGKSGADLTPADVMPHIDGVRAEMVKRINNYVSLINEHGAATDEDRQNTEDWAAITNPESVTDDELWSWAAWATSAGNRSEANAIPF